MPATQLWWWLTREFMRDGIIWVRIYEKSAAGNLELFENASILNASTSPDMTQALLLAAY